MRLFRRFQNNLRKLRRNRSNTTLLDSETHSNFSSVLTTPKRALSLRSIKESFRDKQRSLLSVLNRKTSEKDAYLASSEMIDGKVLQERNTNKDNVMSCGEDEVLIKLRKDRDGLGFNIVGGIDSEHIPGDPGIFISRIRVGSAASRDRRLSVGDRIISVNGLLLNGMTRDEATQVLRSTTGTAVLLIEKNAEFRALNKPTYLSGYSSSDESASNLSSDEHKHSSSKSTSAISEGSMNTYGLQIMSHVEDTKNDHSFLEGDGSPNVLDADSSMTADSAKSKEKINIGRIEKTVTATSVVIASRNCSSINKIAKVACDEGSVENETRDFDFKEDRHASASSYDVNFAVDDEPMTPKRTCRFFDSSNSSIFSEVIAVSAGIAALGVGIYLGYHFLKHRSLI
ncbi:unnamed protein product [Thelazia callipaeda]|uniref:PDZ domain-containing protein n=1 Tax=Thelazia callipaeda TaxID=103827 RepID=A0A0N5DAH0_THECL|nr:unnamed protein product [Thelazia callipaeda]